MEKIIKNRIEELIKAEQQHMANYNAAYGARMELERLLKEMEK